MLPRSIGIRLYFNEELPAIYYRIRCGIKKSVDPACCHFKIKQAPAIQQVIQNSYYWSIEARME